MKDLMSLLNGNIIPAAYKDFYTSLSVQKDCKKSAKESDDDCDE